MTFDDYCKATGHYAEAGDRTMWEAATKAEREACAKLCDNERAEFMAKAGENNGRESDFAFGSVNSAERIASAIRLRSNA